MKKIIVLMREDANEAMRVAAGLTIFGHEVGCVMINDTLEIESDNEYLEMLDLADIEPVRLIDSENVANRQRISGKQQALFDSISRDELSEAMNESDAILSF